MRSGNKVFHGLTVADMEHMMAAETFANPGSDVSRMPMGSIPGSSLILESGSALELEADADLVAFTSWYEEVSADDRSKLDQRLRNAARNLVRHRGFRSHVVVKGKCKRVADDIMGA